MEANCRREVEELHRFFEDWLTGACDENLDRCDKVLAKDFEIVWPSGSRMKRHELLDALAERYGENADLQIRIDNFHARVVGEGLCLVTYEEHHRREEGDRGRLSTALFRGRDTAPHGVELVHVHETWLPNAPNQQPE